MTDRNNSDHGRIVDLLTRSYNAELETVMNYLANSVNLDGIRAEHIKKSLDADVAEELGHARQLAARIKVIGGSVPGSLDLKWSQKALQPPKKSTVATIATMNMLEYSAKKKSAKRIPEYSVW